MILAVCETFDKDINALGGIITFFELGFYTGNIYSAVNCAHKFNRDVNKRFLDNLREKLQFKIGFNPDSKNKSHFVELAYHFAF